MKTKSKPSRSLLPLLALLMMSPELRAVTLPNPPEPGIRRTPVPLPPRKTPFNRRQPATTPPLPPVPPLRRPTVQ
jgi:hypothetical protein